MTCSAGRAADEVYPGIGGNWELVAGAAFGMLKANVGVDLLLTSAAPVALGGILIEKLPQLK